MGMGVKCGRKLVAEDVVRKGIESDDEFVSQIRGRDSSESGAVVAT